MEKEMSHLVDEAPPKSMSLQELKRVTKDFSNEIGRGRHGVVYKGRMDGKTIAVKVPKTTREGEYQRHGDKEFKTEFESLLTLRHPNIIRLVGYRYEIGPGSVRSQYYSDVIFTALCFEHAANGSLRNYISDSDDRLDWHTRYKIIKGTLEGLNYILRHPSSLSYSVRHADLTPENILLCDDMVPKIGDSGVSMLFRRREEPQGDSYGPLNINFTTVRREHYITGLGITILKIVAGPDAYDGIEDMTQQEFIQAALKKWRVKLERTPIYRSVSEAYCEQVKTCLEISFKCIDIDRNERPKVSEIIDELKKVEDMIPENKSEIYSQQVCKRQALELILTDESAEPIMLSYAVLEQATNNFSEMIGSGGFGEVYMGVVHNMKVAVKKLSRIDLFSENQFKDEVTCLMRVKHENIVRFLGYCSDTQQKVVKSNGELVLADVRQRLLCFEYVPNKSLHDYLKDESSLGREWNIRYRLIKGICQGLCYLHEEERITHLDLKPDNILLDHDMNPKITDFGLSRRFGGEQSRIITKNIIGSMGYMAPEYQFKGEVSFKSDIFSLGIIIIKILRGHNLLPSIQNWHESLDKDCPQVRGCIEIAQMCVEEEPNKRPTIDYITDMLNELETV